MSDPRLRRWLDELLRVPGLTAVRERGLAWRTLVEGSLVAVPQVRRFAGTVVDVGSGAGVPGVPLAIAMPDREIVLLEASERKCRFLERVARELPNVTVVRGRAEEQPVDRYGVALARALAPPPVATEWCLPLVAPGGAAILFVGPFADTSAVARVSARLGGGLPEEHSGLLVVAKLAPTPVGFPRRTGMARKRPLV
ncbi:MAG TPA: 16S rRNA (guanine(527)-N(7))-methyltransferase RsmG [Gaiellaceae bacterium]|nr:16S rRNA (guanine(527)-N(7))-methyltransferase RsmG [Gaiellaceae bacterium]